MSKDCEAFSRTAAPETLMMEKRAMKRKKFSLKLAMFLLLVAFLQTFYFIY